VHRSFCPPTGVVFFFLSPLVLDASEENSGGGHRRVRGRSCLFQQGGARGPLRTKRNQVSWPRKGGGFFPKPSRHTKKLGHLFLSSGGGGGDFGLDFPGGGQKFFCKAGLFRGERACRHPGARVVKGDGTGRQTKKKTKQFRQITSTKAAVFLLGTSAQKKKIFITKSKKRFHRGHISRGRVPTNHVIVTLGPARRGEGGALSPHTRFRRVNAKQAFDLGRRAFVGFLQANPPM